MDEPENVAPENKAVPIMDSTAVPATEPDLVDLSTPIGERLRAAREAQGKSIGDIATAIKVPARLLDAIERGAVDELPVGPYAIGFTRNYAQAVGIDPVVAVAEMRAIAAERTTGTVSALSQYEPADASRVPSRALAFTAAGIAGLLVIGYLVWRFVTLSPDVAEPVTTTAPATEIAAAGEPAPPTALPAASTVTIPADAPVLISASETVWFSLEDANGRGQFDLTLNAGEFYTVKPGQRGLFLRTARPQSLRLVVGDRRMPQLGAPDATVSGIGLDAASLSQLASNPPSTAAVLPSAIPQQLPGATR
jgi:cytoskeleton protein RodZ